MPFAGHLAPGGGPLPPLLFPSSPNPNMLSPVLSPSFWPPTLCSSPFCSPQLLFQPGHHETSMMGGMTSMGNPPHRARPYQGELHFEANNNSISEKGPQLLRPSLLKPNQFYHEHSMMGAGGMPPMGNHLPHRAQPYQAEIQYDANNNVVSDKDSLTARPESLKPNQFSGNRII